MVEFLPIFVLTPTSLVVLIPYLVSLYRQHQLRKTAKMLLKNGAKHALVTKDQIIF